MQARVVRGTIHINGELPADQWPGFVEACNALIAKQAGKDIAQTDTSAPPAQTALSPGSLLTTAIHLITGEQPSPACKCKARAKQMDEWGWWKCWLNREAIAEWLVEEARRRKHEIDERRALSLFRAAWKEIRHRRKDEATRTP